MSDVVAAPVLILASQRDFAADRVIRCLQDLDVPVERWNAEDERVVAWRPEQAQLDPPPRAVWLRQYLPEHRLWALCAGSTTSWSRASSGAPGSAIWPRIPPLALATDFTTHGLERADGIDPAAQWSDDGGA